MEVLLAIILGILFGIITGLIPGIHINLIATLILVFSSLLLELVEIKFLIIFIITMGIIHSFVDFIPSILFGVPDSDTALSVLPGHRLVLEGRGYEAIFLSSFGSLCGTFFSLLIIPLFFLFIEDIYSTIKKFIPYLLMFTLGSLILLETTFKKKFLASIIVIFSGALGILILNSNHINHPLLILFTGLFGISSIYFSLLSRNNLSKQTFKRKYKLDKKIIKALGVGGISSTVCSISPGIGNAQAGTLASLFFKSLSAEIFIVVLSSINTINFILSFLTFYSIQRARNGSVFVISQLTETISFEEILIYIGLILFISILGFFLTTFIGKKIIKIIIKLNIKKINFVILFSLLILVLTLSGPIGFLGLLTATTIGIACVSLNVRRVHLMGCLLVPVIFNLL